jgi:hypothetical protein
MENRTSAAKTGYGGVIYGTAEPVPFQDRVLTHALKPDVFSINLRHGRSRALVRLQVYLVGEVEVLFRHALSGL